MSCDEFLLHQSNKHTSVYSRADYRAILSQVCQGIVDRCSDGVRVQVGEFGAFYPTIKSSGVTNSEDFNPAYDIKDRVFTKYGWNEILKERKCTAIGEDEMGDILLGTDQGLYIYNRKENRVSEAPHSKALKTLIIFGFQCDKDNDIWISTSMGLWHWSRDNDEFVAHINGSGLVAKEYLGNSSFHFTDGRIGFGTNKGITVFNPNEVKHSVANLGKVFLSSILVGNNIIGCTDTFYKLKHDNSFVLKYSLFNFQDNDDITFQYRINNSSPFTI